MANANGAGGPAGGTSLVQVSPAAKCRYCDGKHYAKGMCQMHYRRMWRHGDNVIMPSGKASPNYGKRTALAGT